MSGAPVSLVLLRHLAADLPIRRGDVLPARVLAREGPMGVLQLAGVRVDAQLPPQLAAGMRLRLRVAEATSERVTLRVVPSAEAPSAAAPAGAAPAADPVAAALRAGLTVGLPGGAVARLFVDPEEKGRAAGGAAGRPSVTLRYEAAALGRVDVALGLLPGAVTGTIHVAGGEAAERLRAGADELRAALAAATGRPASVTVRERVQAVDLHA